MYLMATHVYVDGFNLYNGCVKHNRAKWLDLEALFATLLPDEDIAAIRYFTAPISGKYDKDGPERQQTYLRALRTLPKVSVHEGKFKSNIVPMRLAYPVPGGPTRVDVIKREEKRSDVSLGAYMIFDLGQHVCDTVVLVSNDSDFCEPMRMAHEDFQVRTGIINPHPRKKRSLELAKYADFVLQVSVDALTDSLFPNVIEIKGRRPINKPANW